MRLSSSNFTFLIISPLDLLPQCEVIAVTLMPVTRLDSIGFISLCNAPSDITWLFPLSIPILVIHWSFYYRQCDVILVSRKWCLDHPTALCCSIIPSFSIMLNQVLFMTISHRTNMVPATGILVLWLPSWSPPCSSACKYLWAFIPVLAFMPNTCLIPCRNRFL